MKNSGSCACTRSDHWRLPSSRSASELNVGPLASGRLVEELAADQHAPDLGGARADLVELRVAPQPPDGKLVDVAVAAERLDRLACHPRRLLRGVQDRTRGILARRLATIAGLGHRVDIRTTGVQRRVHVSDLALHQLEFADRLPELLAI